MKTKGDIAESLVDVDVAAVRVAHVSQVARVAVVAVVAVVAAGHVWQMSAGEVYELCNYTLY